MLSKECYENGLKITVRCSRVRKDTPDTRRTSGPRRCTTIMLMGESVSGSSIDSDSWAMYAIFGIAILIGTTSRLGHHLTVQPSAQHARHELAEPSGHLTILHTFLRKLSTPTLFGRKHSQPALWGWATIPTRLEGLFIAAYLIVNFVFCFVNYYTFEEYL